MLPHSKKYTGLLFFLSIIIFPLQVFAEEVQSINSGNTAWLLTSTALVLFMTLPGLSLFYGGLVRSKNVLSILMQCFSVTSVVSILWMLGVYSLAFGKGNAFIGDFSNFFMAGISESSTVGDIPESVFSMFQLTFAIITPALILGAYAERLKFTSMLLFSSLWLILIYGPITHWVWGGGWLQQMGLLDFAGGTVVHISAGVAALVTALVIGQRKGFNTAVLLPHNMTMVVTGAGMLWVGWFGFNAGSALAANSNAGMAMLTTHISASAGAMVWTLSEWKRFGKPSVLGVVTGMVAGLGTITPASGYVGPGGALVIGTLAGLICFNATNFVKQVLKIDDSLDVFPVHGIGGILGTLLAGVFAATNLGVFSGHGFASGITSIGSQVLVQLTGVVSIGLYTAVLTWIILKLVNVTTGLRVSAEEEEEGLDLTLHDERGYVLTAN